MEEPDRLSGLYQRLETHILQERFAEAVDEVMKAIREAEQDKREDDICYLYKELARLYFLQGDQASMRQVLDECERTVPGSVLARYCALEMLLWFGQDYVGAINKANEVIEMVGAHLTMYNRAFYLKGLAHAHLGQFEEAAKLLEQTNYYDLAIVEKLISERVGLEASRGFLLRALEWLLESQANGKNVDNQIRKALALLQKLSRTNSESSTPL